MGIGDWGVLHLATVSEMLDDSVEETVEQLLGGIELLCRHNAVFM